MGWVIRNPAEEYLHTCFLPELQPEEKDPPAGNGSIWECLECFQRWIVEDMKWVHMPTRLKEDKK